MDLESINNLPDRVSTEHLEILFQNLIDDFHNKKIEKNIFFSLLIELTDRQVMTYEILEQNTRADIDHMLSRMWNTDSYEEVDIILSIVVNLGLEKCFEQIKRSVEQELKIEQRILDEILQVIDEVEDHITNPYHGLERLK